MAACSVSILPNLYHLWQAEAQARENCRQQETDELQDREWSLRKELSDLSASPNGAQRYYEVEQELGDIHQRMHQIEFERERSNGAPSDE